MDVGTRGPDTEVHEIVLRLQHMVTAWIGMWYPLDQLVYYARPYRLETKALEQLAEAEVVIEPQPVDI